MAYVSVVRLVTAFSYVYCFFGLHHNRSGFIGLGFPTRDLVILTPCEQPTCPPPASPRLALIGQCFIYDLSGGLV